MFMHFKKTEVSKISMGLKNVCTVKKGLQDLKIV
jgi:hypothetical protein